jgi:hypothetical protein
MHSNYNKGLVSAPFYLVLYTESELYKQNSQSSVLYNHNFHIYTILRKVADFFSRTNAIISLWWRCVCSK